MKYSSVLAIAVFACIAAAAPLGVSAAGGQEKEPPSPPAFGYDIFRPLAEPIVEGPVDDEYIISPGDEIVISIWGQLNLKYALTVTEDGYIELPDEGGRIFTNGVSIKELKRVVTESLSRIYSGYINAEKPGESTAFVDIRLGRIRKLLIYVMGEVKQQGAFGISSSVATLFNSLTNAGGVKETGTLREIMIRRADGTVETVDLYDFLITGKLDTRKTRIRYGDYIIVPLKAKSVTIKGEIQRPGVYEMIRNEGIRNLVRFAGGLAPNASLNRAQVRRFEVNAGEKFIDIDLEPILAAQGGKDFILNNGDEVTILSNVLVRRRMVEISGEGIKRPGIYEFKPGMTVRDLIEAAEGLKEYAHLERADLVRTGEDFSKKLSTFSLAELYQKKAPGTYVFAGTAEKNFPLKEMDQVVVYSTYTMRGKDKHVILEGRVKEPRTYLLADNMTLYDLIFLGGGFQDEDFKKRAFLDMAHIFRNMPGENEKKIITFNLGKLLDGDPGENMSLEDGDRVMIYSYETTEIKPFVTIEGLIIKPGDYTLASGMTLVDLILLAGGLRPDAFNVQAVIARMGSREKKDEKETAAFVVLLGSSLASAADKDRVPLKAYDKVVIRNLPDWEPLAVVDVEGEILYSGSYSLLTKEERISSIIRRAGGLKKEAFPEGASLLRRKDILGMSRENQLQKERIAINLPRALRDSGGPYDLILKDGDNIFIPSNPGSVKVKGAVRRPSMLQHRKGENLNGYIELCGGYLSDADKQNTVVYLPNNTAQKRKRFLFFSISPSVPAGSVIEVPFKSEDELRVTLDVEVRGAARNPSLIRFKRGASLDYYINFCGGYLENADSENLVIHLPDGNVVERKGREVFSPEILPGSVIEVPAREGKK